MASTYNILISVPHGNCKGTEKEAIMHRCDSTAVASAKMLAYELKKLGQNVMLFDFNQSYRDECDENRFKCRKTIYRNMLRREFEKDYRKPSAVLDVHSFPNKSWKNYHVVILDRPGIMGQFIWRKLQQVGYACKLIGIYHDTNDIMEESYKIYNIPSVLIELNEDLLKSGKEMLKNVCYWITIGVLTALESYYNTLVKKNNNILVL